MTEREMTEREKDELVEREIRETADAFRDLFGGGGGGRYLLNSAVITAEGVYEYRRIAAAEARAWYASGPAPVSTIGYAETAAALGELLGTEIAVDRRTIRMEPGDEALVFRLVFPPGTPRIDPADKGRLREDLLAEHFELGLLARLNMRRW